MKISIIVPVYNNEYYLKRCLKSIIKQTYKDLDIIIIDDGSTDKSPIICDRFAKKDGRIKVIHKENEGVSVARNTGIKMATGDWLCFVDSDDILPLNSIEILVSGIDDGVDFVCGAVNEFTVKSVTHSIKDGKYSKENCQEYVRFLNSILAGPVAKLYKTNVIIDNNIEFPVGVKFLEDAIFWMQYVKFIHIVKGINTSVYYYNRLNQISGSNRKYPLYDYSDWVYQYLLCSIKMCGDGKTETLKRFPENQLCFFSHYEGLIRKYILSNEKDEAPLSVIDEKFRPLIVDEVIKKEIDSVTDSKLKKFYYCYYLNQDIDEYKKYICNNSDFKKSKKGLRLVVYPFAKFIIFKLEIGYNK